MATSKIKFTEPPCPYGGQGRQSFDHQTFAEALKANPGQWAEVPVSLGARHARSLAYSIKNGKAKSFRPAGAFEGISRVKEDGTVGVWVRYVLKKRPVSRKK